MNLENQKPTETYTVPVARTEGLDEAVRQKEAFAESVRQDGVSAQLGTEAVESAGMITMTESAATAVDQMKEEREASEEAASIQRKAEAQAVAKEINDTRPEGVPSSLPTSEEPSSTELTASTVRSYKDGIGRPQN